MEAAGKMGVLDRLLARLKARGHRVTLFSQSNRMLDIIEDYLLLRGYKCAVCSVACLLRSPMIPAGIGCLRASCNSGFF